MLLNNILPSKVHSTTVLKMSHLERRKNVTPAFYCPLPLTFLSPSTDKTPKTNSGCLLQILVAIPHGFSCRPARAFPSVASRSDPLTALYFLWDACKGSSLCSPSLWSSGLFLRTVNALPGDLSPPPRFHSNVPRSLVQLSPGHLHFTWVVHRTWRVHDGNHAVIRPTPGPTPGPGCRPALHHCPPSGLRGSARACTDGGRLELFLITGSSSRPLETFYLCFVCLSSNDLISHSLFSTPD